MMIAVSMQIGEAILTKAITIDPQELRGLTIAEQNKLFDRAVSWAGRMANKSSKEIIREEKTNA